VIRCRWNALQPGDRVIVHDHGSDVCARAHAGTVVAVLAGVPTNEVGIRLDDARWTRIAWPIREVVHAATDAAAAACLWCAVDARSAVINPMLN
jgi:hypothetical protein